MNVVGILHHLRDSWSKENLKLLATHTKVMTVVFELRCKCFAHPLHAIRSLNLPKQGKPVQVLIRGCTFESTRKH